MTLTEAFAASQEVPLFTTIIVSKRSLGGPGASHFPVATLSNCGEILKLFLPIDIGNDVEVCANHTMKVITKEMSTMDNPQPRP